MGRNRWGRGQRDADGGAALAAARSDLAATTAAVERLADVDSVDRAVEVALELVCEGFGWTYGSYWALDPTAGVLRCAAQHGQVDSGFAGVTASATFAEGVGLSGRAWARRELVFVRDLGELTDCVRAPAAQRAGVRSGICFPVFQDGHVVGTMDFFTLETLDPGPGRLQALRSIAVVVSQALERVAELERQRRAAQDVTAVTAMLRGAMGATTEEQALADALHTIRHEFDWAYGSYWRLDGDAQVLTFVRESGDAGAEFREVTLAATFAHGVGLSGRAWARGELVFVEDLGELRDCVRAPAAQRAGVKSGVCFPILVEGRVVGTMDFFATRTLVLSESRRAALRNTGFLLGQTLERLAAASRLESAGRELVASIEEVERNVVVATEVASQGQRTVLDTDREVTDLGRASREIGKVVKVITGIAAQTNLLALNATIEAARAGDAGRGFAVVAGEVKDLATETARATTDVDARVQAIQTRVDGVTAALSDIRDLVDRINATQTVISGVLTEQVAVTRAILG